MARPRVLICCDSPPGTVAIMAALNPKRYRIAHHADLNEAALRANFMHAHVLIVHAEDHRALAPLERDDSERVERILVSPDPQVERFAREVGAQFVPAPFDKYDLKKAVYRAVRFVELRRGTTGPKSAPRDAPRILVVLSSRAAGEVVAGVLQSALGRECLIATHLQGALEHLEADVACVVAQSSLMTHNPDATRLASTIAHRGIGVIPVPSVHAIDEEATGQLAWNLVPRVRLSLEARAPKPPADKSH